MTKPIVAFRSCANPPKNMYFAHTIFSSPTCTVLENIFENILETLLENVHLDVLETFGDFTGYCTRDYWRPYVRFPGDYWRLLGTARSDCIGETAFLL
jgi:hypothetical protein